jgi:hypothetical protein
MTRAQRIVAVLYCLLVVYCGVWVPWARTVPLAQPIKVQEGYDWVWSVGCEQPTAASTTPAPVENTKPASDTPPKFEVVDAPPPSPCHGFKWGEPDIATIALRLVAATGLCGAAFLLAGKWRSP